MIEIDCKIIVNVIDQNNFVVDFMNENIKCDKYDNRLIRDDECNKIMLKNFVIKNWRIKCEWNNKNVHVDQFINNKKCFDECNKMLLKNFVIKNWRIKCE